ncbi:MAG: DNA alkylation repair protein [Actinomycetota bacterium]|nr:DNA alkylation repair protein [Actinomycetota bacterium]
MPPGFADAVNDVPAVLALLNARRSNEVLLSMGPKYGIHTTDAIGVSMADMKSIAKLVGKDHDRALSLWSTGGYEARTVAALTDDATKVTMKQMDAWCRDFDNWAICDTVCFNLFDRTPNAWKMVDRWAGSKGEFVKRAAFALLWSLALHDKAAPDELFIHGLELVAREANDDRNFVTKAIAMSMRAIGRRNEVLAQATLDLAAQLLSADDRSSQRLGRTAWKELTPSKA